MLFCFCRNWKKLHTNWEVLNKLSGLPVAVLWMGGVDRDCMLHILGGLHPYWTSHKESRATPWDQVTASPSECFSVGSGIVRHWENKQTSKVPREKQAVDLWQTFCLFFLNYYYYLIALLIQFFIMALERARLICRFVVLGWVEDYRHS